MGVNVWLKVSHRPPQAIGVCAQVCANVSVQEPKCMLRYSLRIDTITPECYGCAYSSSTHTASGHTQSLHFKDSTPLFCYTVIVESQLHSNKISRTGGGRRGVFWVLNNVRRREKILLLFVSRAGHNPHCSKTLVIDKGQGNVILHWAGKRDWIFGWISISQIPTQVQVSGNVAPYLLDV